MTSRSNAGGMHIALNVPNMGWLHSGWRLPEVDPLGTSSSEFYVRTAQLAEQGLFDVLFLADIPALTDSPDVAPQGMSLDPVLTLTAVAQHTERIGLVPTVSTSFHHPYNVARTIGSLDRISHGRAGWNAVTSYTPNVAANFGSEPLPSKADRYARAEEFLDVVGDLWRTWSTDAIVADKDSGVFARRSGVNPIKHDGSFFSVTGGSTVPPSTQGYPVTFQAGASDEGLDLAAAHADAVFVAASTVDLAVDYRRRLHSATVNRGRSRRVLSLPGVLLRIASTEEEAIRRRDELDDFDSYATGVRGLAKRLGLRVQDLHLDSPVPLHLIDVEGLERTSSAGFARSTLAVVEGRTVREIVRQSTGFHTIVGSPKTVADTFETWFSTGAIDGFTLMFDVIEQGLPVFVNEVVPILQERGLFRRRYAGSTLREHLGLAIPRW
ncbi:hypothetical protein CH267_12915 [Rhodococcus sp. 06-621-2]|nr:NtaA/DmoA family FMN-dependent monooxygenase [Rhodococcus sp. 06-621-2]OZC55475.1 hypothetical protein CH267_12915 [Rhodococcus sp. 06-621-2]